MINKIKKALEENDGLTITELVNLTKLKRCQVRTQIAFLLGAKEIEERNIGTAKFYKIMESKK